MRGKEKNSNTLLGILPDLSYDVFSLQINPGDSMLLYSDGVSDTIEINGKEDSALRLAEILEENHYKTSKQISDEIFSYLSGFRKIDDRTVVVVKRL